MPVMRHDGWRLVAAAMQRRQNAGRDELDAATTEETGLTEAALTAKRLDDLRRKYVKVEDRA